MYPVFSQPLYIDDETIMINYSDHVYNERSLERNIREDDIRAIIKDFSGLLFSLKPKDCKEFCLYADKSDIAIIASLDFNEDLGHYDLDLITVIREKKYKPRKGTKIFKHSDYVNNGLNWN